MNNIKVDKNGAILLGKNFTVDGYSNRPIRVVTHAHEDHMKGLRKNIKESIFIIATPITHEFLNILGYHIPEEKAMKLDYNRTVNIMGENITLKKSRHIAGSAQVVVDTKEEIMGYTGDFKLPGTEPLKDLDTLVVDATYGNLKYQRGWADWDALGALINIIDEYSKKGPIWIYGYNGKLQEIMVMLRERGIKNRFLADEKTLRMAQIASNYYGVNLWDASIYNKGLVEGDSIIFIHTFRYQDFSRLEGTHIMLTGWELRGIAVKISENQFNVSFSDHATFKEIVEYVKESNPRKVIIDGSRSQDSWYIAKYLSKILNITTEVEPK
jgi:Predicted exonuclease of the beta-lactamase fold involved in RNA processing